MCSNLFIIFYINVDIYSNPGDPLHDNGDGPWICGA